MERTGRYDSALQMFIEAPLPIRLNHLAFLRWLGEQGQLEHDIAGDPSGPLVGEPLPERQVPQ